MIVILRFFTCSISFTPCNDPIGLVFLLIFPQDKETDALGVDVTVCWLKGDDLAVL